MRTRQQIQVELQGLQVELGPLNKRCLECIRDQTKLSPDEENKWAQLMIQSLALHAEYDRAPKSEYEEP